MNSASPQPFAESVRHRIAAVLFVAQSFFSASTIAAFTLSPIIAATLSGQDGAAGVPNTVTLVGRMAFAYPMGFLMDRIGRRLALTSGYGISVVGALISFWAVVNNSYPAFLLGALLLGMARSAGDLSRYVAAEVYPLAQRAKVIGILIFAGTIGSISGPQLVPLSEVWVTRYGFAASAGPFAVAAVAMLLGSLTVFLFLRPDPLLIGRQVARQEAEQSPDSRENATGPQRTLREIFAAPLVQLAVLSMLIGYFVMAFLMVITPLHMNHHDHNTVAISNVIFWHTLGMFGLSWLTGWLIDRFGRITMIVAGAGVLIAACITAPLSTQVPVLSLSLFLLGLGWNFCYVAGSSLLSDALSARERARAQGASEVLVSFGAGMASLSVGAVFAQGDYLLVSAIGLAFTLTLLLATGWLVRRDRAQAVMAAGGA